MDDLFTGFTQLLKAAGSTMQGILSEFVIWESFLPALVVLIISAIIVNATSNFWVDLIGMLFAASSCFFLLLSVIGIPEGVALFIAVAVLVLGLVQSWGDAGSRKTKILDAVVIVGLFAALLYIAASALPEVRFSSELSEALDRLNNFIGRVGDASGEGAELLNDG